MMEAGTAECPSLGKAQTGGLWMGVEETALTRRSYPRAAGDSVQAKVRYTPSGYRTAAVYT